MEKSKINSAFSLIEISIVLVIMGMLVAGVIAANAMIERSKINAAIKEIQGFRVATANFYNAYGELPGDARRAIPSLGLPDIEANMGDGNGMIGGDDFTDKEAYLFFKHLSAGRFIEQHYDIRPEDIDANGNLKGIDSVRIGSNFPGTKLEKTYFYYVESSDISGLFTRRSRLGLYSKNPDGVNANLVHAIDVKIDDGLPYSGRMTADKI